MELGRGILVNDKMKLLASGFYNLGGRKGVKCRFCNLHIRRWRDNNDLIIKHFYKSPNCILVRDSETNVYMDVD